LLSEDRAKRAEADYIMQQKAVDAEKAQKTEDLMSRLEEHIAQLEKKKEETEAERSILRVANVKVQERVKELRAKVRH